MPVSIDEDWILVPKNQTSITEEIRKTGVSLIIAICAVTNTLSKGIELSANVTTAILERVNKKMK